ncbi:MAG: hypothetical protein JXR76_30705 [Deltaproteobacteria bacterium]|nr:hypothetical protein [Deltaproteobacteria bacterium]
MAHKWEFDRLGRAVSFSDPKGNVQTRRFDLLFNVTEVHEPDGNIRRLAYDAEGNVVAARDQHHDVRFGYQGMGKMAYRQEAGTTVQFAYDTEERLLGIKNEHGSVYLLLADLTPYSLTTFPSYDFQPISTLAL